MLFIHFSDTLEAFQTALGRSDQKLSVFSHLSQNACEKGGGPQYRCILAYIRAVSPNHFESYLFPVTL